MAERRRAHVSPGLLHVPDHLGDSAAIVVSDLGETLVQNPVALALTSDESHRQGSTATSSGVGSRTRRPGTDSPWTTGPPTCARTSPISAPPPPAATAIPTSSSWSNS